MDLNLTNPSSHFGALSQFEFVSRDTKKSEFLGFMDFGDASFAVPTNHHPHITTPPSKPHEIKI